jgi:hypothetical protein
VRAGCFEGERIRTTVFLLFISGPNLTGTVFLVVSRNPRKLFSRADDVDNEARQQRNVQLRAHRINFHACRKKALVLKIPSEKTLLEALWLLSRQESAFSPQN